MATRRQQTTIAPNQTVDVRWVKRFLASALPLTLELAHLVREELEPTLPRATGRWSYEDRVFATLAPGLRPDIALYYRDEGPDLRSLVGGQTTASLKRLDEQCLAQLWSVLQRRLPEAFERVRSVAGTFIGAENLSR